MKISNMNMGSTASDLIAVLTGNKPVQTASAVTVDTDTQAWITNLAIGGGVFFLLMMLLKKK